MAAMDCLVESPNLADEPESLEKTVNNTGVIVDYLEKTFVEELDNLYGPTPSWYVYQN